MSELIESEQIKFPEPKQEVVQNSDTLFRKPFEVVKEIEPQPINQFEKDMLKGTKDVETLLKEEQEEKEPELTEEEKEKIRRKAYVDMIKVIALDKMGLPVLSNPSTFTHIKKEKLKETMYSIME